MAKRTGGRTETPTERADRNLDELLQELRVALPGVQVLFAFLLTVPFTQRFTTLSEFQENVYFGTLMSTALATVLLIAPTANHRMLFRKRQKQHLVEVSNRLAIAGLAVLALAMCGVIFLISDVMFDAPTPFVATALATALFLILWFAMPLIRRFRMADR